MFGQNTRTMRTMRSRKPGANARGARALRPHTAHTHIPHERSEHSRYARVERTRGAHRTPAVRAQSESGAHAQCVQPMILRDEHRPGGADEKNINTQCKRHAERTRSAHQRCDRMVRTARAEQTCGAHARVASAKCAPRADARQARTRDIRRKNNPEGTLCALAVRTRSAHARCGPPMQHSRVVHKRNMREVGMRCA